MGSRFYFGGSDDSGSDLDETQSSLPFPKPLAPTSFLAPEFDPTTFLSGLSNRFQTLDDLQNELRALSQSLNKELLDLVNDNYQDFLSLGSTLSGGEEKVEQVRVGLLGFQRELGLIRSKVDKRRDDVANLLQEKRTLKQHVKLGRALLEIAERIEELEEHLMIGETVKARSRNALLDTGLGSETGYDSFGEESDDETSTEEGETRSRARKLARLVEQFLVVKVLVGRHDANQTFIVAQKERLGQIQTTLRLDIESARKQDTQSEGLMEKSSAGGLLQLRQRLDYDA